MSTADEVIARQRIMWAGTIHRGPKPTDVIDGAAAAGYGHVAISPNDLRAYSRDDLQALAAYGRERSVSMTVVDGYYSWLPLAGTRVEALAATQDELLFIIEGLGAHMVNVLAIPNEHSLEAHAEYFAPLCDALAEVGAKAALEFTPLGGVHTLADGLAVIEMAGRPNGGLVFDTWHFFKGAPDQEVLARATADQIFAVQFSDATTANVESLWHDTVKHRRHCGDGEWELVSLTRQLEAQGLLGWYGPEVISLEQQALSAAEAGRVAGSRLDAFLHEVFD